MVSYHSPHQRASHHRTTTANQGFSCRKNALLLSFGPDSSCFSASPTDIAKHCTNAVGLGSDPPTGFKYCSDRCLSVASLFCVRFASPPPMSVYNSSSCCSHVYYLAACICHCSMWKTHYRHYHPLLMSTGREQNSCLEAWKIIISQRKCPCWCLYGSANSAWL